MIPTSNKSKISCKHSYPLGAKTISETLGDLPQSSNFTISFSSYDSHNASISATIRVMNIEYSFHRPKSESMMRLGFGTPKWKITVYPVPRQLKHRVKEVTLATGIPLLREWCIAHADITGDEGCERISAIFHPTTEEIRFEHFSNMNPKVSKRKNAQSGPRD